MAQNGDKPGIAADKAGDHRGDVSGLGIILFQMATTGQMRRGVAGQVRR